MKSEVLICRHGETHWNCAQILQGQLDSDLTSKGRVQARQLAERALAWEVDRVVSSPLGRALQTADIVAEALEVDVDVCEAIQERSFGHWQGQPIQGLQSYQQLLRDPAAWEINNTVAEVEPLSEVCERFEAALSQLYRDCAGQTLLLVSHGHIMEAVARQWQPTGVLQNGAGFRLQYRQGRADGEPEWQWAGWLT